MPLPQLRTDARRGTGAASCRTRRVPGHATRPRPRHPARPDDLLVEVRTTNHAAVGRGCRSAERGGRRGLSAYADHADRGSADAHQVPRSRREGVQPANHRVDGAVHPRSRRGADRRVGRPHRGRVRHRVRRAVTRQGDRHHAQPAGGPLRRHQALERCLDRRHRHQSPGRRTDRCRARDQRVPTALRSRDRGSTRATHATTSSATWCTRPSTSRGWTRGR